MEFVLVNGRTPAQSLFVCCAVSQSERAICEKSGRDSPIANHNCYVNHCTDSVLALENPRPEDIPCYRRSVEIC
jgi:hypothetical protein